MTPQRRCASPNAWPARQPPTALPSALTAADAPPRRLCPRRAVATALLAASASRPPPARLPPASPVPLLSRPAQAAPRTRDALSRRSPSNVALTRDRVSPTAHTHTNAHHVPLRLLPDNHTLHDTGVHGDGPVHRRRAEPSSCSATSSAVSRCRQHPVRRRRRHRPLRRVACAVARPAAWPPPARTWPRLEPGLGRSRPEPKNGAQLGLRSEQERVRAAVLSTASSRCGLLGLALDEILSLASRLRWLAPKSFLSVRFSCFSSKRPNSAAMTDVGAARVRREAFAFAGVSQKRFLGVRETVSDPKREFSECRI